MCNLEIMQTGNKQKLLPARAGTLFKIRNEMSGMVNRATSSNRKFTATTEV